MEIENAINRQYALLKIQYYLAVSRSARNFLLSPCSIYWICVLCSSAAIPFARTRVKPNGKDARHEPEYGIWVVVRRVCLATPTPAFATI